jgi:hypothetical protein
MFFKIIDNALSTDNIDNFYGYFRDLQGWVFTGHAGDNNTWRKFHGDLDKNNDNHKKLFDLSDEIMQTFLPEKEHKLKRAYVSSYLYGTHHEMHTDGGYEDHCYTVMFYLNKVWAMSYGGETIFTNPERTEIIHSVIPKPGRALLFDGFIPHCAREISRTCIELRMVATLKYFKNEK